MLLHDTRDPDTAFTYQAETGEIVEAANKTLLVMRNGTIQRRPKNQGDISIVRFESYAFDLSNLIPEASQPVFKASERSTTNLIAPARNDAYALQNPDKLRNELYDRFSQPLYSLAFGVIVFAFLGKARTTRQNRSVSVLGAISACVGLRTMGFGVTSIADGNRGVLILLFIVPLLGIAIASWSIFREQAGPAPRWLTHRVEQLSALIERIAARLSGRNMGGAS